MEQRLGEPQGTQDAQDSGDLGGMVAEGSAIMDDGEILSLCDRIREISLALHGYLRHGHLEKVYENGLTHRLRKEGIRVEQQHPLVELKSCKALADEHTAQILGYLRASRMEHGLLINFGARRLEIRKFKL